MKEVDDTPVDESESECCDPRLTIALAVAEAALRAVEDLEKQVANLEARRPPQDTNPDPEWYA